MLRIALSISDSWIKRSGQDSKTPGEQCLSHACVSEEARLPLWL